MSRTPSIAALRESVNALKWVWKLPLTEYPFLDVPSPASLAPYFADWARHPDFDDYWREWSIEDHYANISVPAYCVGGWYDIFQGGTIRNYIGLKSRAPGQRLMIGPWYHGPFDGQAGELNFGAASKGDTDTEQLRWYDHLLRGVANGVEHEQAREDFRHGQERLARRG